MDLTSVETIKNLLSKYDARPNKLMGQNFLIDESKLKKIIETAQLTTEDTILEIGPGIGTLTKELAQKSKKVISIEKDRIMVEILKETLKDYENIEIIQGNALNITHYSLPTTNYKLVANIPYYLTSPLIRTLLESENRPSVIVLMVQKEVAQRICSEPPNMSLLAVSVQFYAKAEIISYVSKGCFWPSPKVDSAIIKITPFGWAHSDFASREASERYSDAFFKVVKAGFSQPRKQLANNLSKSLEKDKNQINSWLLENKINPKQRAETLSINDWKNLTNSYKQ